jgi:hypothetical protein
MYLWELSINHVINKKTTHCFVSCLIVGIVKFENKYSVAIFVIVKSSRVGIQASRP